MLGMNTLQLERPSEALKLRKLLGSPLKALPLQSYLGDKKFIRTMQGSGERIAFLWASSFSDSVGPVTCG